MGGKSVESSRAFLGSVPTLATTSLANARVPAGPPGPPCLECQASSTEPPSC